MLLFGVNFGLIPVGYGGHGLGDVRIFEFVWQLPPDGLGRWSSNPFLEHRPGPSHGGPHRGLYCRKG